jgi:hypothetical protein
LIAGMNVGQFVSLVIKEVHVNDDSVEHAYGWHFWLLIRRFQESLGRPASTRDVLVVHGLGLTHFRLQRFDLRREQVGVSQLVLALAEALHLDKTLIQQGFEAIVGFTQTHAQRIGQIALAEVRVDRQKAQDLEVVFFLEGWKL